MGGINSSVDFSVADFTNFDELAMVIMPGGLSWETVNYPQIADFIKTVRAVEIPVAAICGATYFLCKHGFLNEIRHTGDALSLFQSVKEYTLKIFISPPKLFTITDL